MDNIIDDYDIVVIGGGISGACAAISASRAGMKVLVIERFGYMGGTLTASGTGPMMTFHAGERQVVQGITGEIIDRLVKKGKSPGHLFDTTGYTYSVTPFDAESFKSELEEMLLESGGTVLYHSLVYDVEYDDAAVKSISVASKEGLVKLSAKIYIDASGDADISRFASLKTNLGRKQDNKCQPVTLNMKLYNVDTKKVREYIKNHPEDFPLMDTKSIDKAERISVGGFTSDFSTAVNLGEITFDREYLLFFETNNEGEVIVNTTRVSGINPLCIKELTMAEIEGRRQCAQLFEFLRKRVFGFENARVAFTGPNIGIRNSVQIEGKYTLSKADVVLRKEFNDTIAHGAYPIDIHSVEGADMAMFDTVKLENNAFYSIPYRSLIGEAKNLITVGRCISATFEAQAAIRVSPIAGAIGHAGGAAATVAVENNSTVQDVCFDELRQLLLSQGAYLK